MATDGLKGDTKRQAVDPIRGYVYQFYQSVLAWINLSEDEILVLEGAEDFDILQGDNAKTVQIKDTGKSGSFSLNREEATKSLNNFWEHKQKNPEFKVEYHYLTTSPAGQERSNPFGENVKGVEYWQKVKSGEAEIGPLRKFLLTQNLDDSLKSFLRDSPDEVIIDELIKRIHWDTGQRPIEVLIQVIQAKLVSHGERQSPPIPATDSIKALPQLFESVIHCIIKSEDRSLRRQKFLIKYEEATGSLVSFAQQRLMAISKQSPPINVLESLRPIPKGACPREQLVEKLYGILQKQKILFLNGSTGTGKTTLAGLIANRFSGEWKQLSLRSLESSEARNIFTLATQNLISMDSAPNLVLDDVDFKSFGQFGPSFLGLARIVKSNNAFVIVTSQSEPPQDIYSNLWVDDNSVEKVPYLTEGDISELLRICGCTDDKLIKATSTVIWLTTTGHPQLVHARVRHFEKLGWPMPDEKDFLQTADTEKVKREARARLIGDLKSDATKELAYRLSILGLKFPKRVAMGLADVKERIDKPGEAFEELLGPWIEDEGADYFRVSPLLSNAASDNYAEEDIKRFREAISLAYIRDIKTISMSDASSALIQAFYAKSNKALFLIARKILVVPIENRREVSKHFFWLAPFSTEGGSVIVQGNPQVSTMLRHLQFISVAYSSDKSKGSDIATLWLEEIRNLEDDTLRNKSLMLAFGEILISYEVPYDCGTIVRYFPEIRRISDFSKELKGFFQGIAEDDHIESIYGHADPIRILFSFLIARIRSKEDLVDIFDALNEIDQNDRAYLIEDFNQSNELNTQLINAGWIRETDKSSDNISACIRAYEKIADYALSWGATNIFCVAVTVQSVLHDENLSDFESALGVLNRASELIDDDPPILRNQRAKVFFNGKKYREAINIWAKLLPEHGKELGINPVYLWRDAAIAAAALGEWSEAVNYFESGSNISSDESDLFKIIKVGMYADSAYAEWKAGNPENSLRKLSEVLKSMEELKGSEHWQANALEALVGHTITWLYGETSGGTSDTPLTEPFAGMLSNPSFDEGLKDWKTKEIKYIWALLGIVESRKGLSFGIKSHAETLHDGTLPVELESAHRINKFQRMFDTCEFESLVSITVELMETIQHNIIRKDRVRPQFGAEFTFESIPKLPEDYWKEQGNIDALRIILNATIVVILSRGQSADVPTKEWKGDCISLCIDDKVLRHISLISGEFQDFDKEDLYEMVAFKLLTIRNDVVSPRDLFDIHFYMLSLFIRSEYKTLINKDIEAIVVNGWTNVMLKQRFQLTSPQLYENELREIIERTDISGRAKAAEILLMAKELVRAPLQPSALDMLRRMAKGDD